MSKTGRRHLARPRRTARPRALLALGVLVAAGVGVALAWPYAQKAIREFQLPLEYARIIRNQAHQKHLDPALIAAVIYAETRFDPRTSAAGAEGLMQLEPATAVFLAHRSGGIGFTVADLGHPQVNIAYGSYYLRYLLNRYHGSEILALAAYNGGETNVDVWVQRYAARGQPFLIKDIPIAQTQAYVEEVLAKQREYRQRYARQLGYD